jgi:hypothetical protein
MGIPYQERFANEAECIKYDDQRANELERSLRNQVRQEIEPDTEMGKDKYFMVLQKFGLARARLNQTELNQVYKGQPSRSYRDERYSTYKGGR